ncbi:MAG: aminotransferase class IV [Legionella sp.]|nr:aminotransferase class IV [Legionella sp.]
MKTAFVNGQYYALADAKISIFDRGMLFGDAVYEVLPVYDGCPFFVEKHLARLYSNLEKIKITAPNIHWNELITRLISDNGSGDLQIYIQITRGDQGFRKHDIPSSLVPSVIAFTIHNTYPTLHEKEQGLSAKLIEDSRWKFCDIKTTSLLANILLHDDAVSSGFQTALLVRDGLITEGSTSNVFVVNKAGQIETPSLNHTCLPGITRQVALDLISELNWPILEKDISIKELFDAQEVWITSTTKEIFPVTRIDDILINNGQAGNYWRAIEQSYRRLINHE